MKRPAEEAALSGALGSLEFMVILLPLLPDCWDYKCVPLCPTLF